MIKTLDEFSRRVDELKSRVDEHRKAKGRPQQREPWVTEFRNILRITQESPASLRNRVRYLKADLRAIPGGQARALRRQPAAGGLHRQEIPQPRPELPGPDPGGQRGPDAGGRQVRVPPRLQVLHLRHLVDPPGHHPRRGRPEPHHPHSRPHGRDHVAGAERLAAAAAEAGPRADDRGNGQGQRDLRRRGPPRAGHEPLSDQPRPPGGQQRGQPLRRPAARRRV